MEAKVSIIIPAYNAAALLPACLDSVLSQSLRELELILVNDGSTDDTAQVCDSYAARDARVRVIHKQNEGVSMARNTGLAQATGAYVWFVDADDTIEPGSCETLLRLADEQRADIVLFDYRRVQNGRDAGLFPSIFDAGVYEGEAVIETLLVRFLGFSNEGIHRWLRHEPNGLYVENPALWRTFIRTGLIQANSLRFDPTLRVGEDTLFISLCLGRAARTVVTHEVLYCQLLHEASTVARYEKNPEAKLSNKLALLTARRAFTDELLARGGPDIGACWQGTVVMSYMELCFLFAKTIPGMGFGARYGLFLRYARDPRVAESLSGFTLPRRLSVRAVPFWLMKRNAHGPLFLAAWLLGLLHYEFQRS